MPLEIDPQLAISAKNITEPDAVLSHIQAKAGAASGNSPDQLLRKGVKAEALAEAHQAFRKEGDIPVPEVRARVEKLIGDTRGHIGILAEWEMDVRAEAIAQAVYRHVEIHGLELDAVQNELHNAYAEYFGWPEYKLPDEPFEE